ncbi:MAG: hypothetical protein WKG01_42625, partial [Kofleriaceae bacterium]
MMTRSLSQALGLIVLAGAGCSTKGDAHGMAEVAAPIPVTATFEPTEGDEVRITLSSEGNVDLQVEAEQGNLNDNNLRTEPDGKAVIYVRGAVGPNTLAIKARIDRRETRHVLPFTVTFVDTVVFADATTERDGAPLVGCTGDVQKDRKTIALCPSVLRLADNGTVEITATASSLQKLTIGDQTFEANSGTLVARLDLVQAIRSLDVSFVGAEHPLRLPATLVLTSGTFVGTLELGNAPIEAMFAQVKHGPLVFPGEVARPGRSSLLLISEGEWSNVGKSVPLDQVDVVAFDRWAYRDAPACEYVRVDGSGKTMSVARRMRDHTIVVHERRTGRKLGTRRWIAPTPS